MDVYSFMNEALFVAAVCVVIKSRKVVVPWVVPDPLVSMSDCLRRQVRDSQWIKAVSE